MKKRREGERSERGVKEEGGTGWVVVDVGMEMEVVGGGVAVCQKLREKNGCLSWKEEVPLYLR